MKNLVLDALEIVARVLKKIGKTKIKGTIFIGKDTDEEKYFDKATISIDEAIERAKASVGGDVIEAELEEEDGYLVWEVEVAGDDHKVTELLIDAGNGEILKRTA